MPVQTSQRKKTIRGLSQHVADLKLKFEFSGKEENLKKEHFCFGHNKSNTQFANDTNVEINRGCISRCFRGYTCISFYV